MLCGTQNAKKKYWTIFYPSPTTQQFGWPIYYMKIFIVKNIPTSARYIAGISDTLCLCYCFLCVLYVLAYVWCNDHANSCLHIDFFFECRPHIRQHTHRTQKVGTFVEQTSDFSCVAGGSKIVKNCFARFRYHRAQLV